MSCYLYTRSLGGAPSLKKSNIPGISRSDRRKIMVLFQLNGYFSSWDWDKKKDDKTAVFLTENLAPQQVGCLTVFVFAAVFLREILAPQQQEGPGVPDSLPKNCFSIISIPRQYQEASSSILLSSKINRNLVKKTSEAEFRNAWKQDLGWNILKHEQMSERAQVSLGSLLKGVL